MAQCASRIKTKPLPIREHKEEIMKALAENKVIVVVGHTGCGKSTQLPQMLYEEGYGDRGLIACTQPRRFAAYSLAKRVSQEMGCRLGDLVGYRIRFENRTGNRTSIMYMTDGNLLQNRLFSTTLPDYSVIMLDEVHERALQTDMLFGLLKQSLAERADLRLVVTSATLDATTFSKYFFGAPVIEVSGTMYNVDIVYHPIPPFPNKHVAQVIKSLDSKEDEGDVLVFLAGKPEIEDVQKLLSQEKTLHVLPAHAELSTEDLDRIHEDAPPGRRKIVLATNVAETSLTVEGIVYVVDQGFVKLNFYDGESDTSQLKRVRCSQAEAQQRKGRAGRTKPGVCYRLYSEQTFENEMPKLRLAEVTRANLTAMTLQLKAIGYEDVLVFDFLTRPDLKNVKCALIELHRLEALDEECLLTRKGRLMAKLPLDPKIACCLVESADRGCSKDVLMICSMISSLNDANIRKLSPLLTNKNDLVDELLSDDGEMFALLKIFKKYINHKQREKYIQKYQFNRNVFKEAELVYHQLTSFMNSNKIQLQSCGSEKEPIFRSLASGLFYCLTEYEGSGTYRVIRDKKTANLQTYLLTEGAKKSKIFVGVYLNKPSERKDRMITCVTPIPEDLDLSEYIDRFQLTCRHFESPKKIAEQPFWLVEAKEWYNKFLTADSNLKQQKERNSNLERQLHRVQMQNDTTQERVHVLESEFRRHSSGIYSEDTVHQLRRQVQHLEEENRQLRNYARQSNTRPQHSHPREEENKDSCVVM